MPRVARFRGIDRSEFIDNRRYQGNAFELLLKADRFMREFLPIARRVVHNLFEREDDPCTHSATIRLIITRSEPTGRSFVSAQVKLCVAPCPDDADVTVG